MVFPKVGAAAFIASFSFFSVVIQTTSNFSVARSSPETSVLSPLADVDASIIMFTQPTPTPSPTTTPSPAPTPRPKSTPTPKPTVLPTSSPSPVTGAQIDAWLDQYSQKESVSRDLLAKIARCESGMNPNAAANGYGGLYQFSANSWQSTRRQMNLNPDVTLRFNAQEAIKTAAFRLATSGPEAWPNCSK